MIKEIHQNLTAEDKEFLLDFGEGNPIWDIYDFERFPAVQWKLQNLINLKNRNPEKHESFVISLKNVLD